MNRSLLLYLTFLMLSACNTGGQVLKLMEKNKYEAALTKLDKAIPKDSLNADLYYVYSLLFTDTAFAGYNIDSSYFYILKAREDYTATGPKAREKQQKKLGLDSLALLEQKLLNDSLAYQRASALHSVQAYQHFIDQHPDAPQNEEAIRERNQLAYQAASQLDTYEAYKEFMETYPDAVEFELAREQYNTLVFRVTTRAGNLQSYVDFLQAFPDSPFRPQAEKQILEISTAVNHFEDYEDFIRRYPESPYTPLAVNLLFHLYRDRFSAEAFFQKYNDLPWLDSLETAHLLNKKMLVPIFEDQHYGLMDSQGNYRISPTYDLIPARYLCEGVEESIVHLAQSAEDTESHQLLTKAGEVIYAYQLSAGDDLSAGSMEEPQLYLLGAGILLVKAHDRGFTLLQQSGEHLLPNADMTSPLDTAALLTYQLSDKEQKALPSYQFIMYQVEGLWGLATFTGRVLTAPIYEEIEALEGFILLRKDGRLAVTRRDRMAAIADQRPLELSFIYEEASLLDNDHIIAYTDNYESVIDRNLNIVVPLDRHNVIKKVEVAGQENTKWLLREDRVEAYVENSVLLNRTRSVYYLYDKNDTRNKSETYQNASFNSNWLVMNNQEGFHFFDLQKNTAPIVYDSVKLLGESFALLFKYFEEGKDSVTVFFPNERRLALASPEDISFLLLRPSGVHTNREYLLIAPRRGPKEVWSQYGRRVLMDRYDDVQVYGPGLFVIERNRRKGLLDSLGNTLLTIKYEAISNYRDSLLAVFQGRKFGAYDYASGTMISPQYDAALQTYGPPMFHPEDSTYSRIYIARKGTKYGLVNDQKKDVSAFDFEQIRYWNDTSALVRKDGVWAIFRVDRQASYDKEQNYSLYKGIEELELLEKSTGEHLYRVYKENGYGVISNQRGELLTPTYDDIRLLGSITDPNSIFLAEKYVPEAELYIVIHINTAGEIIKRQALTSEQYDMVFCDD